MTTHLMNRAADVPSRGTIFIVGSPRSGTTWLQLLLASHPDVATCQETHLFSGYMAPLHRRWAHDREEARKIGLPTLMSEEEFHAACSEFIDRIFARIAARSPNATVILEKTPGHALHADLILDYFPEAGFIHVIRDPRAVVNSILRAGESWGESWAPGSARGAAKLWQRSVREGRAIANKTDRYTEVRYERLRGAPEAELGRLARWIGLGVSQEWSERAVESNRLERLKTSSAPSGPAWKTSTEPSGFYRKGDPEGWKHELTRVQRELINREVSPLLDELGYDLSGGAARAVPSVILRALARLRQR